MPTPSSKPSATRQANLKPSHAAFLRGLMDRKNHNGLDPRYFWPHLTPVPWFPVPGVNWPQHFPVAPSSFYPTHDASPGHSFASPAAAAAFARQYPAAMSPQDNADGDCSFSAGGRNFASGRAPSPRASDADRNAADALGTGPVVTGQSQSGPPPLIPTNRALQQLTRHLDDAIRFCKKCLDEYETDRKPYMKECCNWKSLLEGKFTENEQNRYLFNNLPADVASYMWIAMAAAERDARAHAAHAGGDGKNKVKYNNVYHEVDIINKRSKEVVKQAGVARQNSTECRQMVTEMEKMKAACEELTHDKSGDDQMSDDKMTGVSEFV